LNTTYPQPETRRQKIGRLLQDIFVSVIAAAVVAGLFSYYTAVQLENSKDRVMVLIASEQRFDAAHSDVVVQYGLYANELFVRNDSKQKTKFLQAVITTQLELLNLRQHMGNTDIRELSEYSEELSKLRNIVASVQTENQMGPAHIAVQKLLAAHGRITVAVEQRAKIHFLE
jgi:hypothetical protein